MAPPRPPLDNLHSRIVAVLKLTLPLVALAILSTLFLFSRGIDPEDAIPYADVEIADRLAQPRMTGAGFSTTTADGSALALTADEAAPDASGGTASGLTGEIVGVDGSRTRISAAAARLDSASRIFELSGGVRLTTSTGYEVAAQGFGLGTDRTWLQSRGPVSATGPMGDLQAGGLEMRRDAPDAPYLMVFNGGVRLLYLPAK